MPKTPKKTPKKKSKTAAEVTSSSLTEETLTIPNDHLTSTVVVGSMTKTKRKPKTPKPKTPRKKVAPKNENRELLDSDSESEVVDGSSSKISSKDAKKLEAMRARMDLLERDNYIGTGGRTFSVNFDDNEEWNNTEVISSPKKGGTKRKKKDDDDEPNSKKKKTETGKKSRSVKFTRRKFDQVLKMDKIESSSSPNYFTILSQPSILPQRKFCSITGFKANYTCPHSGAHYLSVEAYGHVKKNYQLE